MLFEKEIMELYLGEYNNRNTLRATIYFYIEQILSKLNIFDNINGDIKVDTFVNISNTHEKYLGWNIIPLTERGEEIVKQLEVYDKLESL